MQQKIRIVRFFRHFFPRAHRKSRGQSFVELMLVTLVLALVLAGVVEYGFLLNNYLHVLDGSREAARVSNNGVAFDPVTHQIIPTFYFFTAVQAANTMTPIKLDPAKGDDIIISVYSVGYNTGTMTIDEYPDNGWNLCGNYGDLVDWYWTHSSPQPPDPLQSVPPALADENWSSCPTPLHTSHFNTGAIQNYFPSSAGPNTGVLVVEIFYNYPQTLKLPVFSNIIPDPIPTYVYTIMPISSAEPTLVPTPGP